MSKAAKFSRAFRIESGKKFRLKDVDPGSTAGLKLEKDHAADLLEKGVEVLAELHLARCGHGVPLGGLRSVFRRKPTS